MCNIQGVFFNCVAQKLKFKTLRKFWHIFWWYSLYDLTLRALRGITIKKTPFICGWSWMKTLPESWVFFCICLFYFFSVEDQPTWPRGEGGRQEGIEGAPQALLYPLQSSLGWKKWSLMLCVCAQIYVFQYRYGSNYCWSGDKQGIFHNANPRETNLCHLGLTGCHAKSLRTPTSCQEGRETNVSQQGGRYRQEVIRMSPDPREYGWLDSPTNHPLSCPTAPSAIFLTRAAEGIPNAANKSHHQYKNDHHIGIL